MIDEARVWQIRHGGRLFTAYPFLIAAERGLDEVLPRMPETVGAASFHVAVDEARELYSELLSASA